MLLSIVVSVYHVDDYIEKCLQSILNARLFDYELILVIRDDGESKCNRICYQYQNKYENIKICVQKGTGLSDARNCGMENGAGDYIMFVDGDDYVLSDKLMEFEKKLLEISKRKPDMIVMDFCMVDEQGKTLYIQNQILETTAIELDSSYTKVYLSTKPAIWNTWRYIYSRNYIEKKSRKFLENRLCEDVDFTVRSFWTAENVFYYHNPFYCYCGNRKDSLFNQRTAKYCVDLLDVVSSLLADMSLEKKIYKREIENKLLREIVLSIVAVSEMDKTNEKTAVAAYEDKLFLLKANEDYKFHIFYIIIQIMGVKRFSKMLKIVKKIRRRVVYKG